MKHILFVDDDAPVLNGLRVRLHRLRDKWAMHFVTSGRDTASALDIEKPQSHVHQVAAAACSLAANTPCADDALLAGFLHDIGYWILANECNGELAESRAMAATKQIPLHEAEACVIGASHAQVGAYLLGLWGLPYPVIEAVAYHHTPETVRHSQFEPLAALAIAHSFLPADDTQAFGAPPAPDRKVDAHYLNSMNAPFDWAEANRRVAASQLSQRG